MLCEIFSCAALPLPGSILPLLEQHCSRETPFDKTSHVLQGIAHTLPKGTACSVLVLTAVLSSTSCSQFRCHVTLLAITTIITLENQNKGIEAHLNFWLDRALSGLVYTTRCLSLKAIAIAYSATTVFPAEVWAATNTDSRRSCSSREGHASMLVSARHCLKTACCRYTAHSSSCHPVRFEATVWVSKQSNGSEC